jgi:hypothetical protein
MHSITATASCYCQKAVMVAVAACVTHAEMSTAIAHASTHANSDSGATQQLVSTVTASQLLPHSCMIHY